MGDLLDENSFEDDWYEHNIQEYGTIRDVSVRNCNCIGLYDKKVLIKFDTVLDPPLRFIIKTCIKYNVSSHVYFYSFKMDLAGIFTSDCNGNWLCNEFTYDEGLYQINPKNFVWAITEKIDSYIDNGWKGTEKQLFYLNKCDLAKIKNIFDERSLDRLFDDPPLGLCFKSTFH